METLPYEPIGVIKKARQDYTCMGCGNIIKKGEQYDYSDGWSATSKNEYGEPSRKYYQFRCHIPGQCDEQPATAATIYSDLFDF